MALSPLASPGIGSGLDVNAIVEKLMAVERRPLEAIARQQGAFQAKLSAYGVLKGALSALQGALAGLTAGSAFRAMSATLSDEGVASVAAGTGAFAGSHSIEVTSLAQAHRIASGGFASSADAVGSGTLTFRFGTWSGGTFTPNDAAATGTVTIAPGQSSLAGIRDAVNAAKIGVTATIVDDGSAAGKRLVFASSSGAAMSLKVDVADDDGNALDAAGLSQLAYDPAASAGAGRNMTQTVEARNATVIVDGITVTKPTNVVADAIAGVTLTLAKTNAGAPATLAVTPSAGEATAAVEAFVKAYNDVQRTIQGLTKFDPQKKQGSVLTGDPSVRQIQSRLREIVGGGLAATDPSGVASLAQAGIRSAVDGTLTFDAAKFAATLAADAAGVERLFAALGTTDDALVAFAGAGAKTQPGTHAVTVTQLASRGTLAGSAAAGLTITAGVNDALTAVIDGVSVSVVLAAKTYATAAELAAELAGRLNGAQALKDAGSSVSVSESGGVLTVTSNRFGSASAVAFSGSAAATLVGGAPVATTGTDVAGTIGGLAALGSGRTLTGAAGSAVEGLRLTIEGGALGARGSVRVTRGIGALLERLLAGLLAGDGVFATRAEGTQTSINALDRRKADLEARLERVEAAYLRQYRALDTTIASLSATSTYLTQQLANLPKIRDDD
ncbi:MAG: flagellar filament capping protein FliD [Burkholderiales bacterium]|nr:flagellar filament capping protein FliD [Burkholderiales bacterium]